MLKHRSSSLIGKIPELLLSGNFTAFLDVITTPKSLSTTSSRGAKSYDIGGGGGVGLGIVVALDVCSEDRAIYASCTSPKPHTDPIFVNYGKNTSRNGESCCDEVKMDSHEDIMNSNSRNESFRENFDRKKSTIFSVSSSWIYQEDTFMDFPDFLSSCHLCSKRLHGKDIYMYRGEKAFCSAECRARQIIIDDDDEQKDRESRPGNDVSPFSAYTQRDMFSTGIMVV